MGKLRNVYNIFHGKSEGKIPLGRSRRRWEDNIKTDLNKTGWEGVNYIHAAQDRDQWPLATVNTVMNLEFP
jgi:hypothetical protein